MRAEALLIATVIAAAAAACGSEEPAQDPTFEAIVHEVFEPRCTFSSCHTNPTVAASLDLSPERACDTLVNKPSCLFPDKMRIVPGRPEESFFFHKLTGQDLEETPTGNCGTQTNLIMPFGASALPDEELALIHTWIANGAACTGGGGRIPDPPADAGPAIASLTASRNTLMPGDSLSFTLTLTKAAPAAGQMVSLSIDTTAVTAPVQMVVPEAATQVQFDAYALRPTSRFTIRATTGQSSKELVLRVGGLEIAEVMADPIGDDDQLQWIKLHNRGSLPIDLSGYQLKAGQSNYDLVTVGLSGTIPAGGCVLVGGPVQSGTNSEPIFNQPVDFSPNLPHDGDQAVGFALFDTNASPVAGFLSPVDLMLIGATNSSHLLGPDAEVAAPYCGTPAAGMSAVRTGPGACVQAAMQPALSQ